MSRGRPRKAGETTTIEEMWFETLGEVDEDEERPTPQRRPELQVMTRAETKNRMYGCADCGQCLDSPEMWVTWRQICVKCQKRQEDKRGLENIDRSRVWRNYRTKNGSTVRSETDNRRLVVMKLASPPWYDHRIKQEISRIYEKCRQMSQGDKKYHVDHVVPIQGENVCGLHVPWNLQIIPAEENWSKGNRYG